MNVNPVAVATGVVTVGTSESVRSTTTEVAADKAADDGPILLVAMTETLMNLPISASVNSYVLFVADAMSLYVPPTVLARFHWYAYDAGEPVQEPLDVVNVAPVREVPEITGIAVLVGAMSTTAVVAREVAADEVPAPFVAVTETLKKYPTSSSDRTYELLVADGMSEYTPVDVVERFHWYVYDVGEPVQEPFDVVSVSPVRVVPVMTGTAELDGETELIDMVAIVWSQ